jgi:ribosomal protein S18 acetylase RimI-like enzyme
MTIQIRSFNEKDLPNLVKILNEINRNAYEFTTYTEDWIRSRIQEEKLQILIATENNKVLGSAAYNDGHWGEEIAWLAVSETPNRKNIENELIRQIEKYVKGKTVFTAVDAESPKTNEWTQRGYKPEGGLYHMIAKPDSVKTIPKVPEDIIIRSLKPQEEKELVEAINAGFGWERIKLGAIQKWKSESPLFNEEWIHVAEVNNKIVSVVVSRPDVEYNEFFSGKRGYLGPAATLPEHRSKNLASALTVRAMNFLHEKEMNSVALYTSEQNIPSIKLLQKLGFKIGHHWKFMRKTFSNKG